MVSGSLPDIGTATREVLDTIEDRLQQIEATIGDVRSGRIDPRTAVGVLRQHVHSVKGAGAGIGANLLKVIAHRFEDWLAAVERLEGPALADVQAFCDRLAEAAEIGPDAAPETIARHCRRLPAKGSFDIADVEVRDIEIMIVMEDSAATHFVTRELAECGYRIINVRSSVDALVLAGQMRPDLVIASNVMAEIGGVDFACALRAMPSTRGIPVALLTAESRASASLADLPPDIPTLSKSARFADDVTRVFGDLGLL